MTRYIAPILIGLIGAAILLSLGTWQMQRLAWKEGVLAEIDARIDGTPDDLPDTPSFDRDRYAPVQMTGRAEGDELHVLVSHKKFGPGYRVVTVFETETGRRVLLDHGFIKDETKDAARAPLEGYVTGNLHWPDDRNSSTPENDVAGNIWFARDIEQMSTVLGTEPVLVVLRTTSEADPTVTPLPVDSSAIPNDHLNYAITWFSLAAVWLGMTGFWLWRIRRRTI